MKYNPPTNGDLNNPNRPFINADPSNGIAGSYPSAQSIEHPQREIMAVIEAAEIPPDEEDLTQLYQAIMTLIAAGSVKLSFLRNVTAGYGLSNNAADAVNDLDIQPGYIVDDTFSTLITVDGLLTKRLDALWAPGNNQGGLDIGAKANSTTYHIFAIHNPTTKTSDVLFSTSINAPTLPAGYTKKRRIGSLFTTSAGAWVSFDQQRDFFRLKTPGIDINVTAQNTAPQLYALAIPSGLKLEVVANFVATLGNNNFILVTDPDLNLVYAASTSANSLSSMGAGISNSTNASQLRVISNASKQIRTVCETTAVTLRISTQGWYDNKHL